MKRSDEIKILANKYLSLLEGEELDKALDNYQHNFKELENILDIDKGYYLYSHIKMGLKTKIRNLKINTICKSDLI